MAKMPGPNKDTPSIHGIGIRFRHIRKQKGLKLREVSAGVGLSVPFLSQIENERASTSVANLIRIASFYGLKVSDLISDHGASTAVLMRSTDRVATGNYLRGVEIEWLSWSIRRRMGIDIIHIQPGASSGGQYAHEGEEFVFVLEGTVEVTVGQETHVLNQGDLLYYSSVDSHGWRNPARRTASLLFVTSPPAL